MELLSICLSDIPKDKIKRAENGKAYINIIVGERKQPDQYGNNLFVAMSKTKEEREEKVDTVYIVNGKSYTEQRQSPISAEQVDALPAFESHEDLPF